MEYELALVSVLVAGGYWGWYFVRRGGRGAGREIRRADGRIEQAPRPSLNLYGLLLLVAAGLSGIGLIGRKIHESGAYGIAGAVGVGAGLCLLVVGPIVRGAARRFASAERFGSAKVLYDIAEVLAPGSGVGDEKELLAAMREIRNGNIAQTVDALTAAKTGTSPEARLAIDERIAMLYLTSSRWDEAVAHAEQHLLDAPAGEVGPGPIALRRA